MIKDLLNLIRIRQWYKNGVVFLALFFSQNLTDLSLIYLTVLAFFSLSLISSAGYIFNDLMDRKKDAIHPEKKFRALASGKINTTVAIILALILLVSGSYLAYYLNRTFFYLAISIFILTIIYTLTLKKIVFADILTIGTLFVIRAISGAYVIDVIVSPWLILCPFFLSLFLSVGKRHSELSLARSIETREVLKDYNKNMTNSLMIISTTLLIISYSLYSFLSEHQHLLYTLPFALYVIFRFYSLINQESIIARQPEKVIKDKKLVIGILLWIIITGLLIYL